jgi:LemA protein
MKGFKWVLIAIVAVIVIGVMSIFGSYNNLVSKEATLDTKKSDIGVTLQRRMDLIPNLVETVKGYASHEKEVIQSIADARKQYQGAKNVNERVAANDNLQGALSRLLVIVENYPNLKADANFRQLSDELAGTENRIAVARKDYNEAVRDYNTTVRTFPTVIWSGMLGFEKQPLFQEQPGAEKAPSVKF